MDGKACVTVLASTLLFAIPWCFGQSSAPPATAKNLIFQVGRFDQSAREFAQGSPTHPVDFVVGKSTPGRNWYQNQPVVLREAGSQQPWKITFHLNRRPARWYSLHVAVLLYNCVPVLRIGIDGRHGEFYLHPRLDRSGNRDRTNPVVSNADVVFDFPGRYLHQGINVASLEAVNYARQQRPKASIRYDAISLSRSSAELARRNFRSATVALPTIFYRKQNGQLDELVEVFLRFRRPGQLGSNVSLGIGGRRYRQNVKTEHGFGDVHLEFPVAPFDANAKAKLQWTLAGHREDLPLTLQPQKKWTVYIVPNIHLDIGYSDDQAKVAAVQSRAVAEAMDLSEEHPGFSFSADGEWILQQFMETRSPADRERMIRAMRNKQIFIPAQYANLLTGFASAETLIRSLYPSADFSRIHATPFNYANITDVPSYSWSYASILASAGIEDLVGGSNNGSTPPHVQERLQYRSPMWWVGPDGKKVLFWYSRSYAQMQVLFGDPPHLATGRGLLPLFLRIYTHPEYRSDAVIVYGSQWENTDLIPQQATLATRWNAIYAYPHIEYSGFHRALNAIADQFGGDLPTIRGDGGPTWEDGIASDAFYAAMERANESRGPSAEKLETINSLVSPGIAPDRERLKRMWRNMVLMDEHTFTSHNSVSQPRSQLAIRQLRVKNLHAVKARALVDWLARNSMESIVNSISAGRNSLVVFNMLNWPRSDLVTFDLPDGQELADETTGQMVPYAVVLRGHGFNRIRFLAKDVPAVGYKVYLARKASHPQPAPATSTDTTIESPWYRVVLDPADGAIRSIYDKQLHRELVDPASPYRFGQYLYVTGGDRGSKAGFVVHPAESGKLISVTRTPYGWVARMTSSDTNTPEITTEVRLFDGAKKIELIEKVEKKYVLTKEGVYFAFPFAMAHPEFHYEIQNGVVNPARDAIPAGGHVWFSVQHWVAAEEDGVSGAVLPLDASLVTLGNINRGQWPERFGSRKGAIFSYVMNNYWGTNYAAGQGGHFRFRYVITSSARTDPERLSRMGWEEMTPLESDEVTSQDKAIDSPRPLSGKQGSFLQVDDPDLVLDTWKPAEDGKGTILRWIDLGGAARTVTVRTPLLDLSQAWLTDAVERNKRPLPLASSHGFLFPIQPHAIVTVRLIGQPATR